jgi:hypothetical protein
MKLRFLVLCAALTSVNALAYNPTLEDLSSLNSENIQALLKTVAIGASHRPYMPASPLGAAIGLEIGLDVTAISVPDSFKTAIALASNSAPSDVPAVIPLPKLTIMKGLPAGFDVGFSYSSYQSYFRIYGGEVKWALSDGRGARPAIAFRASGNYTHVFFMDTHCWGLDAVVSKNFYLLEPYAGVGLQRWAGSLALNGQPVPAGLETTASSTNVQFYAGLPLKMGFFKITPEAAYSTAALLLYGAKFSLSF